MHDLGLLVTLSMCLTVALVLGLLTQRVGLSPILGYLLAGIVVGPSTPGLTADANLTAQLAEIGVVLLMFGVGLHFHPKDLLAVRSIAIPGALAQTLIATLLGIVVTRALGWSTQSGLVFGIALSVASTVVLMRVLTDSRRVYTREGRVVVGWLIVEDILTVVVLVLLPSLTDAFDGEGLSALGLLLSLGEAALKLGAVGILVLVVGSRLIPWLLTRIARTRSRELITLSVLVIALAVATMSATVFGVSVALGAFLAGMVVGQSEVSHQAGADALPLRDAFAVLFFVSVGMLFDPFFVLSQPALVLGALAIILIGKPLAAVLVVVILGHPVRTALTVSLGLAQIGEFSFILAELGRRLDILPREGHSALIAGAIFSISLNPLLFRAIGPLETWLRGKPRIWSLLDRSGSKRGDALNRLTTAKTNRVESSQAVVVGFGPVGRTVTRVLSEFGLDPVVVDLNMDTISKLAADGRPAIFGDGSQAEILKAAGIETAQFLLVTLGDLQARVPVITAARNINPKLRILVRAHYLTERESLVKAGATAVCFEEVEAAIAIAGIVLRAFGADEARAKLEAERIREEFHVQTA